MSIPQFLDADRPRRQDRPGGEHAVYADASPMDRRTGEHLRMIHDNYRGGFAQVQQLVDGLVDGVGAVADVRAAMHRMGLTQAYQQLGSFCGQLCRAVEAHHRIEDAHLYPALRAADRDGVHGLEPVLDRLAAEHVVVHEALEDFDGIARGAQADPSRLTELAEAYAALRALVESHFAYEEEQIGLPLAVHGVRI
ncbi:hemerythrin domain-containing protein [Nocardioidaceae bacterium]|nr:hemerythrin domain-containing protein [Nocardioidaceae bacterium]